MGEGRGLIPKHNTLDPVNILLTRYQSVNKERECIEGIEKTRTVGFRVSKLAWTLYDNILNSQEKETLKYLVEGTIIALAKQKLGELPCEQQLQARLAYAAVRVSGGSSVTFNVQIARAESRSEVKLNIDLKEIEEVKRLLEHLLQLATSTQDWRTQKILRQRVAKAQKILDKIIDGVN